MENTKTSALASIPFATLAYVLLVPPAAVLQVMLQIWSAKMLGLSTTGTVTVAGFLLLFNLLVGAMIAASPVVNETVPGNLYKSLPGLIWGSIGTALVYNVFGGGLIIALGWLAGTAPFLPAFGASAGGGFALHVIGAIIPAALAEYRWQLTKRARASS